LAREADLGRGSGPARQPAARPDRPAQEVQPAKRGGFFGFVGESIAELRKVEWPKQNQVIQGTVVVLVACVIVGTFLWLNDQLWKEVVQKVLIK
jgi:preprotein translocase subunit SecE